MGRGRVSLSKKVKDSVKGVIKFVNNFEETAAEIAINNGYQFVVCGHIHHPQIKTMTNANGESVMYLNSGDWVENSTALEYDKEQWTLYKHVPKSGDFVKQDSISFKNALSYDQLLQEVVSGLNFDAQ
jgi:UDP-2,3-diacylglucosamine pyrophosphatase LpxH